MNNITWKVLAEYSHSPTVISRAVVSGSRVLRLHIIGFVHVVPDNYTSVTAHPPHLLAGRGRSFLCCVRDSMFALLHHNHKKQHQQLLTTASLLMVNVRTVGLMLGPFMLTQILPIHPPVRYCFFTYISGCIQGVCHRPRPNGNTAGHAAEPAWHTQDTM